MVVIRRVILLASFLLTGFVIATCWSATASADERGIEEAPQPVHNRLVAMVAKSAAGPAESDAVGAVHELVDVEETVGRVDEIPALSQMIMLMDVESVNSVDDVANVADLVRDTSGGLVALIDTMVDHGLAHETPSASLLQVEPESAVVDDPWPLAEVARSTVTSGSGRVNLVSTVSSGSGRAKSGDTAPVSHVYDDDLSNQVPNGFPTAPFSAVGTGGGASAVNSFVGSAAGDIIPGTTRHDDAFVVSGVAADGVCPVRQLSTVPQVFPA